MSLAGAIQYLAEQSRQAGQPTDYLTGTVTSEDPLKITIDTTMQELQAQSLLLTEPVVEKKIPVLTHKHYISTLSHMHTCPTGTTSQALTGQYLGEDSLVSEGANTTLQGENIVCYEHGEALPVEDGYIILNRKLEQDDKVLMLRVSSGQLFIVLSRIFTIQGGG